MIKNNSALLGEEPIGKLLKKQSTPAAIGILMMSFNMIADTVFIGHFIGKIAIAAITVAMSITFFISSVGMAIGVGGSSVLSRALGEGNLEKAKRVFGNQLTLTLLATLLLIGPCYLFRDQLLLLFGAKEDVLAPAITYFNIVLFGVFFLTFCMTGNPVVRAEGKAKFAMIAMIVPAILNVSLDALFIVVLDYGIAGAAWATSASYFSCFAFIFWFFISKNSELKLQWKHVVLKVKIVKEIVSLGVVTLARQSTVTLLSAVLHNKLILYGGPSALAVYGIISRMFMFVLFPIFGITQGFLPIASYNFGAKKFKRLRETINKAILWSSVLATGVFLIILVFPEYLVLIFSDDSDLLAQTPNAMRIVFACTPLLAIQLIGAAYFQATGKAIPALLLTLTKQGFFLIPLVVFLPTYFGLLGIWIAFPIADLLSIIVTGLYLKREVKRSL
jgi:putative MATE family efflux protein